MIWKSCLENSLLSFLKFVPNTRNLFLLAKQRIKFYIIILETNLEKEKHNKPHQEHCSSCYVGPFRYKLAVEAKKQLSTEFPSRALFSQEYPGNSWLLPSGNEAASILLSLIKLPL